MKRLLTGLATFALFVSSFQDVAAEQRFVVTPTSASQGLPVLTTEHVASFCVANCTGPSVFFQNTAPNEVMVTVLGDAPEMRIEILQHANIQDDGRHYRLAVYTWARYSGSSGYQYPTDKPLPIGPGGDRMMTNAYGALFRLEEFRCEDMLEKPPISC